MPSTTPSRRRCRRSRWLGSAAAWPTARPPLDQARGGDLLVVGSHGHGGFAGALLGSVGRHCAQHAPCPVVVVRR
ncbi:universal stress protein [Streptomyces sp. NPDC059101]|uniref:universal stress protein n=1 Tax=Streptomyces sp. NPDC059101 TaxID=3346728 RepID=UPI0036CCF82B